MSDTSTLPGESIDSPIDNPVSGPFAGHVAAYLATGGTEPAMPAPLMLITTRGRSSGRWHRTAVFFAESEDGVVVFGSNLAGDSHPHWYLNLLSHPHGRIRRGTVDSDVTARPAGDGERDGLWRLLVDTFPPYEEHQAKVDRTIGILVLRPALDVGAPTA